MLIRYAMLVALAASSVWCLIVVSRMSGSELLLVFGLPALVDACFKDTRTWSYLLVLGGLIYGVFYLAS
jgi:hypothetical protein